MAIQSTLRPLRSPAATQVGLQKLSKSLLNYHRKNAGTRINPGRLFGKARPSK